MTNDTPTPGDELGGWDADAHRDAVDALVLMGEWTLDDGGEE